VLTFLLFLSDFHKFDKMMYCTYCSMCNMWRNGARHRHEWGIHPQLKSVVLQNFTDAWNFPAPQKKLYPSSSQSRRLDHVLTEGLATAIGNFVNTGRAEQVVQWMQSPIMESIRRSVTSTTRRYDVPCVCLSVCLLLSVRLSRRLSFHLSSSLPHSTETTPWTQSMTIPTTEHRYSNCWKLGLKGGQ